MAKRSSTGLLITVLILLLFALFPFSGGAETSIYKDSPLSGSRIFFQKGCAQCHSILDVGGKVGPDLGKVKLNYSFFGVASSMWNHAPKMLNKLVTLDISFPKLTREEMDALITFLSYLNYLERPSDPDRGRDLFKEKRCVLCHSVGGMGGNVGPALDKFHVYRSSIFITTALWNKSPKMAATMRELAIERPEFAGNEIMDIMAFIRENAGVAHVEDKTIYAPPGDPKVGESLFREKRCISCHSIHGDGGKVGPDLGRADLRISFTEIAGKMWNHGPKMWEAMSREKVPVPQFSETEMSDVLSYIYFSAIQEREGRPLNGELLIKEKGCNVCHPIAGKGGNPNLAPDLARKSSELKLNSPSKVITEMWNHIQSMGKRVEEMGMTWPTINSSEMADITAYIVKFSKP